MPRKEKEKTVYILVAGDDQHGNMVVQFVLIKEGYEVETVEDPRRALQLIQKREPDLLLIDVTMPYLNGFEFAARLRDEGYEIPLIFITDQDAIESKLQGFKVGADDYICQPCNYQELVARIRAVMRRVERCSVVTGQCIRSGRFELFPTELRVTVDDQNPIMLTPTEMHVLRVLMSYPGQVVKREQLWTEVWNEGETNSNVVDVYIRRLRTKLEVDADNPRHIISIRGIGYKFLGK
jgi:DNA-binding response OmpR family regulator